MELLTGVCGICNSESLVLNSKDSEKFYKIIFSLFQNDFCISYESYTNHNMCPICIHHISLINSKKEYFSHKDEHNELEVHGNCTLCKESVDVFAINDAKFLSKLKSWMFTEKGVVLCPSCFHLIEVRCALKDNLMSKKLSENGNHTDKLKCTPRRRKSTIEKRNSSEESTSSGRRKSSRDNMNDSVHSTISNSTPIQSAKKRRRSVNLGECMDKESKNILLNSEHSEKTLNKDCAVYTKSELSAFNNSNISKLSPLSYSNFKIGEENKLDKKIYNCIPFVKMEQFKDLSGKLDSCSYVCSLISSKPMIKVKKTRTPPIKIKSIKNLDVKSNKRNNPGRKEKSSLSKPITTDLPKLVVKVERMKFAFGEDTNEEILISQSDDENKESKVAVTPKKQKRVHFNDTPTIIITEDVYSDDEEQRNKQDEIRKNMKVKSIMVSEQMKSEDVQTEKTDLEKTDEEKSDNEEPLSLTLDSGSEDEPTKEFKIDSPIIDDEHIEEKVIENDKDHSEENPVENETECSEGNLVENDEVEFVETAEEVNKTDDSKNGNEEKEENSLQNTINEGEQNEDHTKSTDEECCETQTQTVTDGDNSNTDKTEQLDGGESNEEQEVPDETDSLDGFEVIDQENDESNNGVDEIGSNEVINNEKEINTNVVDEGEMKESDDAVEKKLDSEMEKDSLDGFKGFEGNVQSNEQIYSETLKSTGIMDEVDLLVQKYSTESPHKKSEENEEKESEATIANGNNSPIKEMSPEKSCEQEDATVEPAEDFGSLIDEVQKCLLTPSTDIFDKTEQSGVQLSSEENTPNILEILNSSLDDCDSLQTENVNGHKRKHSDDETDSSAHKKGRTDEIP